MPHIPVHPSAIKRHRQSLKRHARNQGVKSEVRSAVKEAAEAIENDKTDRDGAQTKLREAIRLLDKAATKGAMHRNTARRKVARLSARLHRASAAASQPQA